MKPFTKCLFRLLAGSKRKRDSKERGGMLDAYVTKNNKKLRLGYTTGSCAAGAAKAAALCLLSGQVVPCVELLTPKGILLRLEVLDQKRGPGWVSCAIEKDGGDDPDATHGLRIYAKVSFMENWEESQISIEGGEGVGRVTKKGLEQPVGTAAINRVPREMIAKALEEACAQYGESRGLQVVISIPGGEKVAQKTFNPRLGIVGGLSVLGTSGIVEPMSEEALIASIRAEIRMQLANGRAYLLLVPGNYGTEFLGEARRELLEEAIKCSNFVGEALDVAVTEGAKGVLLVGHIGKFVKLAAGIMNTHSRNADGRMEILTAHGALQGADRELCRRLMDCVTTDEALDLLEAAGLLCPVMEGLLERMEYYVNHRCYGEIETGIITFSRERGFLGQTRQAKKLLGRLEAQKKECGQQS
ncbi:MAG: cobalamin biosynthesis protein CbiD [Lachnospiraceae bacterium]|nr:cobalamin biosynthesis protein CbiD [Lachnospiraceae bacterium]